MNPTEMTEEERIEAEVQVRVAAVLQQLADTADAEIAAAEDAEEETAEVDAVTEEAAAVETDAVVAAEDEEVEAKSVSRLTRLWGRIEASLGRKDVVDDSTGFKVLGDHWLAVWSNDFKDRDGEIFTRKAIDEYVARVDMGIVPPPELWDSHVPGTKSGQAEFVARHGHFLVALGTFDGTPKGQAAKAYYSRHAKQQGISHGFRFAPDQFDGKHYHAFNTFEISVLPRGTEANRLTSLEGIKAMALTEQKESRLVKIFGKSILDDLEAGGKELEALRVEFKDFTGTDIPAPATDDNELAVALKELLPELIGGQAETMQATTAAVKAVSALEQRLKKIEAFIAQTPKRASKAVETEMDEDVEDEDEEEIVKALDAQSAPQGAKAKALGGFYNRKFSIRNFSDFGATHQEE